MLCDSLHGERGHFQLALVQLRGNPHPLKVADRIVELPAVKLLALHFHQASWRTYIAEGFQWACKLAQLVDELFTLCGVDDDAEVERAHQL